MDTGFEASLKELNTGIWIMSVEGSIDTDSARFFQKKADTLFAKKPAQVLFDLGRVKYVSSVGLSAIVSIHRYSKENQIPSYFYDPQLSVRRVFEISKLDFLILSPDKLDPGSPFADFIKSEEPQRAKLRQKNAERKLPPRSLKT